MIGYDIMTQSDNKCAEIRHGCIAVLHLWLKPLSLIMVIIAGFVMMSVLVVAFLGGDPPGAILLTCVVSVVVSTVYAIIALVRARALDLYFARRLVMPLCILIVTYVAGLVVYPHYYAVKERRAMNAATQLVEHIEAFRTVKGRYPATLKELEKASGPNLPTSPWKWSAFEYSTWRSDDEGWYRLSLLTPNLMMIYYDSRQGDRSISIETF